MERFAGKAEIMKIASRRGKRQPKVWVWVSADWHGTFDGFGERYLGHYWRLDGMVPTGIELWEESLSSVRNHLKGKVSYLKLANIMARVRVKVGQNLIDFVITRQSAEELR